MFLSIFDTVLLANVNHFKALFCDSKVSIFTAQWARTEPSSKRLRQSLGGQYVTTTVRRSNSPFSGLVYNFAGLNAVRIDCLILVSGSNVWSISYTLISIIFLRNFEAETNIWTLSVDFGES